MKTLTKTILGLSILASSALATDISTLYAEDYNERIQVENNNSVPTLSTEIKYTQTDDLANEFYSKYAEDYNERIQVENNNSVPSLSTEITYTQTDNLSNEFYTKYAEDYNERAI